MPTVRKLAPEEVQTIENKGKGLRKITEEQYDRFLSEYEVGDYGEAQLDDGEKRLTVRNRLKGAAGRRQVGIDFQRTQGNIIRFKIVDQGSIISKVRNVLAKVPTIISSESPPATRRGGRPKKVEEPPAPAKGRGGRPKKTA